MKNKTNQLVIIFCFLSVAVKAQEVLIDMQYNSVIQREASKTSSSNFKIQVSSFDTISLPLIDDFSKQGIYPDTTYWIDKNVFINTDYPFYPPTIGVATFDGVDPFGNPYDFLNPTSYGIADYLTSRPVRLDSNAFTKLSPADSVYLSFFYQPQGRGNAPDLDDSLVLEFKTNDSLWTHIWSVPGRNIIGDTAFKQVMISVSDSIYFYKGFQFRFKNYATLSGNVDHWNIDYVRLDKLRNANDTVIDDVAFVYNTGTLLKNFQQMPWQHYLVDTSAELKSTLYNTISNLDDSVKLLRYYYLISEGCPGNNLLDSVSGGDDNIESYFTNGYHNVPSQAAPPVNYIFPSNSKDSAEFEIKHVIIDKSNPLSNKSNSRPKTKPAQRIRRLPMWQAPRV